MPVARSWIEDETVYVYVQSDAGNWAIRTKKAGDILVVSQLPHVAGNLTNEQVEELFAGISVLASSLGGISPFQRAIPRVLRPAARVFTDDADGRPILPWRRTGRMSGVEGRVCGSAAVVIAPQRTTGQEGSVARLTPWAMDHGASGLYVTSPERDTMARNPASGVTRPPSTS